MSSFEYDKGPLYLSVKNQVIHRIIDEVWKPGDMLPSESKLADEFDVSPGTVRKALNELTDEKLLFRRQGKGTFVATHNPQRSLFHFFKMVASNDERVPTTGRVVSCCRQRASREEIERLSLQPRSQIIRLVRLRQLGASECILEIIRLPSTVFSGLEQMPHEKLYNDLYPLYETMYGATVYRAEEKLRAVFATDETAELLNLELGIPLLEIDRTAYSLDKKPIEWRTSFCDTQHCHYVSELV